MNKPTFEEMTQIMGNLPFPAPVEWEALADGLGETERAVVARQYEVMALHLIRFAEYMNQRHGYGCGDQGHKAAVKEQNRVANRVRKALGYTTKQVFTF